MHDSHRLTEGRLARFVDESLRDADVLAVLPVDVALWRAPGEPVPFEFAVAQSYEAFGPGDAWGRAWGTTWLRLRGAAPADWFTRADEGVELRLDLGFDERPGFQAEGLAFHPDGRILKAVNPDNAYLPLKEPGPFEIYVEAASNPFIDCDGSYLPTTLGEWQTAGDAPRYRLKRAEVVRFAREVRELRYDIRTISGLYAELETDAPQRAQILTALDALLDRVDPDDVPRTAPQGRAALAGVLTRPAHASAHRIVAVGHAHIDSAWLWPLRETVRKVARTFSNVLDLMDQDPSFVFANSSAQQFAWIKGAYPALFERIRKRVAEGRFVPVGGMWVESDTNMPSGEALARQFVMGKRFFAEEFGIDTREVWLPDSFGYSAALPQIARLAGNRWFLTQKISWNQTNVMPHHTFLWEGIDGTRIFTHFPPVDTYVSDLSQRDLAHAQRNFRDAGVASVSLVPFGWGDGGGGPTREMLAQARRSSNLEGSPTVRIGSPETFFTEAEAEYPNPPVWSGEMYLELHRGTLTTQAAMKRGNRRAESLLHEAELWAATAAVRVGADYPYDELEDAWRTTLLHQFHDILPGSSISWVHREAEVTYRDLETRLERVVSSALGALAGTGSGTVSVNAGPRTVGAVPPGSARSTTAPGATARIVRTDDGWSLENSFVRVGIDERGLVASLVDLVGGREAVAAGTRANELVLYRDRPNEWEAWDVDEHYRRSGRPLHDVEEIHTALEARGAVCTVVRRFGSSRVVQHLVLGHESRSLVIHTTVDWAENRQFLRMLFPLDVRADRIACETQFGHLYRPTHTNTSWDAARFEFCAQRWVHVGEEGFGVAIANDAVYGHSVARTTRDDGGTTTTVGLSLLRGARFPDPRADEGTHEFTVSVRPGAGLSEAVDEGYALNLPLRTVNGGPWDALVRVDHPAVVVETVKLAEDRSGDLVIRLYEALGSTARVSVVIDADVVDIVPVDLLEREQPESLVGRFVCDIERGTVTCTLRPFQIVTLRARRRP